MSHKHKEKKTEKRCPEYVWCVIPVYNHSATVKDVVSETLAYCSNIVVVDDGSTDAKIADVLSGIDVKVLTHSHNMGKGAALHTGAEYVKEHGGKYILTLDADGQHSPGDIVHFIPYITEKADNIIIGNRHFNSEHVPERSKFGRKFSNFWINFETGATVEDSQSGFRGYPTELLTNKKFAAGHYAFETEILVRGVWSGLDIVNVDISVYYPEREKRITHFRPFLDNLRISLLHSRLTAEKILFHSLGR
jgi:glycosyltransferase involved in cell wall biosynthesis